MHVVASVRDLRKCNTSKGISYTILCLDCYPKVFELREVVMIQQYNKAKHQLLLLKMGCMLKRSNIFYFCIGWII